MPLQGPRSAAPSAPLTSGRPNSGSSTIAGPLHTEGRSSRSRRRGQTRRWSRRARDRRWDFRPRSTQPPEWFPSCRKARAGPPSNRRCPTRPRSARSEPRSLRGASPRGHACAARPSRWPGTGRPATSCSRRSNSRAGTRSGRPERSDRWRNSMRLLATEVMPRIADLNLGSVLA